MMKAAVVRSFDRGPQYEAFEVPQPNSPHEAIVDVLAAGLHHYVRAQANGSHYSSRGKNGLPLIPGIDGVGRLSDGKLIYFVAPDTSIGTMAEKTIVDLRRSVVLPEGADSVRIAAAMNPAMSSWVALRRRILLEPGQKVLVLGATGSSGQMAVQIAKQLGASHVIAAGRDQERLESLKELGADSTVSIAGDLADAASRLGEAASEVDVVVDFLWGKPTELTILPLLMKRSDRSRALTWIQIGSIAGAEAVIPSAALRSANFQLIGSGQGSVTPAGYLAEFPALIDTILAGKLQVNAVPSPLSKLEEVWDAPVAAGQRIVFVPGDN
ncbi:NADPH:quinone reductase [Paenibacillus sp. CCS19]|uniref:quinone oxidoreductase family protein n=1 Tax=Paenibacillus sp. CCS19 TaxID=3158387 RepID=UPI0025606832|nr:zinc-binding alcohol dehydrogenase family protein [Paenibacillus cellulosilyticus]GMK39601.1 NADPH:quinone reductase [Paenibacillus cellulosilyticus]